MLMHWFIQNIMYYSLWITLRNTIDLLIQWYPPIVIIYTHYSNLCFKLDNIYTNKLNQMMMTPINGDNILVNFTDKTIGLICVAIASICVKFITISVVP